MVNKNRMKKPQNILIVTILFAIIIALAINTQPTQASLPEQTVPTVKPKPTKTKSVSGGNQNTPVSTDTSIPVIIPISTSTSISGLDTITQTPSLVGSVIPSNTAPATFIQTQPSGQKIATETSTITVSPTLLLTLTTTTTVTPVIQRTRTDPPVGFTGSYIFLILLVVIVIAGILAVSIRKNRVPPQS
jgi:uncharacterized integral membrane protein